MIIRGAEDLGRRVHPDVLGFKCFRYDRVLRRYPALEWQGVVEGKGYGAMYLHPECAEKLGKELSGEARFALRLEWSPKSAPSSRTRRPREKS